MAQQDKHGDDAGDAGNQGRRQIMSLEPAEHERAGREHQAQGHRSRDQGKHGRSNVRIDAPPVAGNAERQIERRDGRDGNACQPGVARTHEREAKGDQARSGERRHAGSPGAPVRKQRPVQPRPMSAAAAIATAARPAV
jgi:hypothetical protein